MGKLAFNALSQKRRLKWRKITGKRFYRFEVNKRKSPEPCSEPRQVSGIGVCFLSEEENGQMGQLLSEVWCDSGRHPQ